MCVSKTWVGVDQRADGVVQVLPRATYTTWDSPWRRLYDSVGPEVMVEDDGPGHHRGEVRLTEGSGVDTRRTGCDPEGTSIGVSYGRCPCGGKGGLLEVCLGGSEETTG